MPAKFIVKKTIQVDTHEFELEIYPRLVSWEVFPANHEAALYAFSNKEELNKTIEDEHVFQKKEPHADTTI